MASPVRKMSEVMMEMAEQILRGSGRHASDEAAHAALFFANVAWNECVGIDHPREGYRKAWQVFEASNPAFWNELKSKNVDALIDELVRYKQAHYPDDRPEAIRFLQATRGLSRNEAAKLVVAFAAKLGIK